MGLGLVFFSRALRCQLNRAPNQLGRERLIRANRDPNDGEFKRPDASQRPKQKNIYPLGQYFDDPVQGHS
jgi:hypothetical protein